jgi:TolA-binding protein
MPVFYCMTSGTEWVDDLYFLMGKAYYLRKNFDSAAQVIFYVSMLLPKKKMAMMFRWQ